MDKTNFIFLLIGRDLFFKRNKNVDTAPKVASQSHRHIFNFKIPQEEDAASDKLEDSLRIRVPGGPGKYKIGKIAI